MRKIVRVDVSNTERAAALDESLAVLAETGWSIGSKPGDIHVVDSLQDVEGSAELVILRCKEPDKIKGQNTIAPDPYGILAALGAQRAAPKGQERSGRRAVSREVTFANWRRT